jgi:ATP-binding cassette, subfamily B, bacterial
MNFVAYLATEFFKKKKWTALGIFLISLLTSVIQTNGITHITSNIITFAQTRNQDKAYEFFKWFIFSIAVFIAVYWIWSYLQNQLLTEIRPWVREKIVSLLLKTNNQKFSETNFSKLNSPINRIVDMYYFISHTVLDYMLPNLTYLLIVSIYFTFINPYYGIIFLIGNSILALYWYFNVKSIMKSNDEYEKTIIKSDIHLIDLLNNVDKIIYRGQTNSEIKTFDGLSKMNIKKGQEYYDLSNYHIIVMTTIIFAVVLVSIYMLLGLYFSKKMDITMFITSFTILLLYREKMSTMIETLPELVDFIGRTENVLIHFQHVNDNYQKYKQNIDYKDNKLDFHKIQFENVTYKYNASATNVFENRNYFLKTEKNEIIGVTGPSGNGKSTFIKLLLRMYECNSGKITIDNVDLKDIDPDYIRTEITYVNQNSKLFDRKVIDNMLYGCSNREICDHFLEQILKYPNITKLYRNTDIKNKDAGLLGENLSGGQRQIVNMIGGLINPSKILVLDEPTNALDPQLKAEVLGLIKDFSKYKQAVIIITHDKDVFPLFTQQIQM